MMLNRFKGFLLAVVVILAGMSIEAQEPAAPIESSFALPPAASSQRLFL
jgi:hypothetical protein